MVRRCEISDILLPVNLLFQHLRALSRVSIHYGVGERRESADGVTPDAEVCYIDEGADNGAYADPKGAEQPNPKHRDQEGRALIEPEEHK